MSAGLLGPVLCLPLWLLEEADFFDLLFELFCRDEDCLFFFLGLTVEEERRREEAEVEINMYNAALSWNQSTSNCSILGILRGGSKHSQATMIWTFACLSLTLELRKITGS